MSGYESLPLPDRPEERQDDDYFDQVVLLSGLQADQSRELMRREITPAAFRFLVPLTRNRLAPHYNSLRTVAALICITPPDWSFGMYFSYTPDTGRKLEAFSQVGYTQSGEVHPRFGGGGIFGFDKSDAEFVYNCLQILDLEKSCGALPDLNHNFTDINRPELQSDFYD